MARKNTAAPSVKTVISKSSGLAVDAKRSRAAKKAAATRKANAEASQTKRELRLHHKIIAGGMIAAVIVFAALGIRGQLQTYAANIGTGSFTGLAGKCLDNSGARLTKDNKVQLYTCNGSTAQQWTLTSTGSLKANGGSNYCLDVPNNSKAEFTYLRLWTCNDSAAQHFKVANGSVIGTTTGYCATVHYAETDNGTKIWMKACHSVLTDAQKWSFSGKTTSGNSGTVVTPPTSGSGGGSSGGGSTVPATSASGGDTGGNGTTPTGSDVANYNSLSGSSFGAKVDASGSSKYTALPSGSYTFKDFAFGTQGKSGTSAQGTGAYGAQLNNKGILGAGSKYTKISMTAGTSTKASYVPPEKASGSASARTNQLQYLLVSGVSSYKVDGVFIQGTNQGHLYNGLMFNGVSNVTFSNSTVAGVPGNDSGPPGETFMANLYNLPAGGVANITNVTLDGQHTAAVDFGLNSIKGTVNVHNLLTTNTSYSAGVAGWQMSGTDNYYNWQSLNNVRNYNAERHSGTSNFYDPVWSQPTAGHSDINYTWESGWKGGSINFRFTNDAAWQKFLSVRTSTKKITIVTNPHGQGDIRSTVHVYVGGVLKTTSDYVTFTGTNS